MSTSSDLAFLIVMPEGTPPPNVPEDMLRAQGHRGGQGYNRRN